MDYIWGASIVEIYLQMTIDLWKIRSKKSTAKTKQQKRKTKAAIRFHSLHDLQDQARPSIAFLFYPDEKEEIEHTKVAKLYGFIAMKTRGINKNVSKWTRSNKSSQINNRMDQNGGRE